MKITWMMRIVASAILVAASVAGAGAQTTSGQGNEGARTSAAIQTLLSDCIGAGASAPSSAADESKKGGLDLANLDRSVSPCADFYQFANGGWMKNNPIPAAYPRWGSFTILQEHNQDVLHTILEDAAKDKSAQPASNWQKIGDFYASCMDESAIEAAGMKPLEPEFERIAQMKDAASLQAEVARLQNEGVDAIFNFGSQTDFKDSNSMLAGIGQGGLGLPDRDYYTARRRRNPRSCGTSMCSMWRICSSCLGDNDETAAAEAKTVMDIETRLAKVSMPPWICAIRTRSTTRCRFRNFRNSRRMWIGKGISRRLARRR